VGILNGNKFAGAEARGRLNVWPYIGTIKANKTVISEKHKPGQQVVQKSTYL
jgi:hypothetical protein